LEAEKFTADDLTRWLDEFPKQLSDDRVLHDFWPSSPRGEALRRIAEIVYSYSAQEKETFSQTEDRLADASRLFLNLQSEILRQSATPDDITQNGSVEGVLQWSSDRAKQWLNTEIWRHNNGLLYEFIKKDIAITKILCFGKDGFLPLLLI
jgi:hypothetical protein